MPIRLEPDAIREFKMLVCGILEPRIEQSHTVLYKEFEDVGEINFVNSGSVLVGFEINHIYKYALILKAWENEFGGSGFSIGAFETTLNQKTEFVYTVHKPIKGFFIRKNNWRQLLLDNDNFRGPMIIKAYSEYVFDIKRRVMWIKRKAFSEMYARIGKTY